MLLLVCWCLFSMFELTKIIVYQDSVYPIFLSGSIELSSPSIWILALNWVKLMKELSKFLQVSKCSW